MAMLSLKRQHVDNMPDSITTLDQGKPSSAYLEESIHPSSDDEAGSLSGTLDSRWTENTDVPRRRMGMIQVISLVVNQCIDSSMLSLPGLVLLTTGSKPWGVGLWALVGFYTFISCFMFVEYSTAYPFTGGPLIWFDELFHRPVMLAPLVFAWYWVLLATTCGVADNTAVELLTAASPSYDINDYSQGFQQLASVVVITVMCLSLYLVRRLCFALMSFFAVLKILFILIVFVAGMVAAVKRDRRSEGGLPDWSQKHPAENGIAAFSGLIFVSFTYQGWEHTNYIAGEIKNPQKVLGKGIFIGIGLVWLLYILITVALYATLSYDEIVNPQQFVDQGIGYIFGHEVFGAVRGTSVVAALASFSCGLALTYTNAKVRQAIAWQRIVPFYKFTGRQDRQFDSPGGALFMQWFFTVLQIVYDPGWLYTYGYQIELALLAIGMLWMGRRLNLQQGGWKFSTIPSKWMLYAIVAILVGFNLLEIVAVAMSDNDGAPGWWMAIAMGAIGMTAVIHWSLLKLLSLRDPHGKTYGQRLFGLEVRVHNCGDDESELSDTLKALMREARADGTRRRVEYKLHGRLATAVVKIMDLARWIMRWLE